MKLVQVNAAEQVVRRRRIFYHDRRPKCLFTMSIPHE
jgi:hypothetical protein